eukprot:TRINITY_DN22740_c0_g1_i1.p2 TRINITY_DN22740_c0_g1~~TRINITY_DN22740_c0_g1_i1.p2  ORF type:complete len:225 (-),score=50.48 TRINITY_DN22740_c0_g1_i1:159-833(-)
MAKNASMEQELLAGIDHEPQRQQQTDKPSVQTVLEEIQGESSRVRNQKRRAAQAHPKPPKRVKVEAATGDRASQALEVVGEGWWPVEAAALALNQQLFSEQWEARHGAGAGLRAILTQHGSTAGMSNFRSPLENRAANQAWLADTCARLLCVITLDRFGDFSANQAIAPVKETCAQALGVISKHLESTRANLVMEHLIELLSQPSWQLRHSAVLCLKYLSLIHI